MKIGSAHPKGERLQIVSPDIFEEREHFFSKTTFGVLE